MSERKDAQEPSMEEILSSIRRIIADDQEEPKKPGAAQPQPAAAAESPKAGTEIGKAEEQEDEDEDVLELTEVVGKKPEPASSPQKDAPPQPAAASPSPEKTPQPAAAGKTVQPVEELSKEGPKVAVQDSDQLVSNVAANASTSALAKLTRTVVPEEKPVVTGGGKTIEEMVVDLMRPMLKDWLDQNLPGIVERVVEQEVKKLARRAELL